MSIYAHDHKSQVTLPVRPAVEDVENGHSLAANFKGDGDATLEADDAKPRPNIVTPLASLGSVVEVVARFFSIEDSPSFHLPAFKRSS